MTQFEEMGELYNGLVLMYGRVFMDSVYVEHELTTNKDNWARSHRNCYWMVLK